MDLLVGMYGELIATLMLALAALPHLKKTMRVADCNIQKGKFSA
jgi:hypothetical protein